MRLHFSIFASAIIAAAASLIFVPTAAQASISDCGTKSVESPHPSSSKTYVLAKSRIECSKTQSSGFIWIRLYRCTSPIPGGSIDSRVFWMNENCAVKENKSGGEHLTLSAGKEVTRYAPPNGQTGFSKGAYFANYTIFGANGGTSYRYIRTAFV